MDRFERDASLKGFTLIAGVDEAGRGPLAGPVVAAAVILPNPPPINLGIRDSKALSPKARSTIFMDICGSALAIGVGAVWESEIDEINIHRASLKAMAKAVEALSTRPDYILIDGRFALGTGVPEQPVVRGDALSVSIAAASIAAKTVRDRIMDAYHRIYPGYNFIRNKGYGTEEHLAALRTKGPCPIHRKSFHPKGLLNDVG